jgi:transcription termination factor NusB
MASIPEDARAALEAFYKHFEALKRNAEELKSMIEQEAKECAEKRRERMPSEPALAGAISSVGRRWEASVKLLVRRYNDTLASFSQIIAGLTSTLGNNLLLAIPRQLQLDFRGEDSYDFVNMVIENCSQALGLISAIIKPELSLIEQRKLEDLRKEVEKLKDINVRYHLLQAIEEYESGHHPATALIAGKVAVYAIEQLRILLSAKSDEEAAEKLAKALGVKDNERKLLIEKYLKACKLARNFFTHDLNAFPTASDALSLIADAIKLAEWLSLVKARGGQ